MRNKNFKLGELFCGPGGLALGAAIAKRIDGYSISHLWGVDKDEAAIRTYQHNIGRKYKSKGIPCDANKFCDKILSKSPDMKVDALAFGFPCNDFSLVGKQKGIQGKYGNLYKAGIKVIEMCDPDWFIAENVSGIHSANSGKAFEKIRHELENSGKGYKLTTHLYKFELYGVPQYRHRYIIVGIRKDKGLEFKVPHPTHHPNGDNRLKKLVSVSEAFEQIPSGVIEQNTKMPTERVQQRLKFIPPWQNAWYMDELIKIKPNKIKKILKDELPWYDEEFMTVSGNKILKLIAESKLNCKRARMSHIYRRLDPDQPSYTITGSGGGGTHVYHWNEHRALTNIERAVIQGFDYKYKFEFKGTKEEVRKQIGMAVPPAGAKIIFESILKTFAGKTYKSVLSKYDS